jgi:large subunit ribosomal protein L33
MQCADMVMHLSRVELEMEIISIYSNPMARNDIRPVIKLRSTAGTGFTYVTRKNRRNDPDRLTLRKYDPVAGRHVDFREER